jgi:hypothetical protein
MHSPSGDDRRRLEFAAPSITVKKLLREAKILGRDSRIEPAIPASVAPTLPNPCTAMVVV